MLLGRWLQFLASRVQLGRNWMEWKDKFNDFMQRLAASWPLGRWIPGEIQDAIGKPCWRRLRLTAYHHPKHTKKTTCWPWFTACVAYLKKPPVNFAFIEVSLKSGDPPAEWKKLRPQNLQPDVDPRSSASLAFQGAKECGKLGFWKFVSQLTCLKS